MQALTPDRTFTQLSHEELIRKFVQNPHCRAVVDEFISRYDAVIRQTVAQALYKRMAAAGYEALQPMIEDVVNETYCRLFRQDCQALRAFKCRYENSIFAYLRTISLNMVSNQVRAHLSSHAFGQMQSLDGMKESDNGDFNDNAWDASGLAVAGSESAEGKALEQLVRASFRFAFRDAKVNRNFLIFKLHFLCGYHGHELARIKGLGLSERGINAAADRMRQWLRDEGGKKNRQGGKAPKSNDSRKPAHQRNLRQRPLQPMGRC
jgi:DNA-directed RNA polymerase specialized sigma24 family protein